VGLQCPGFGLSLSRLRSGKPFLGPCGFGGRFRDALVLGGARLGRATNGLLGRSMRL
jgi:hypothetical protein